MVGRPKGSKNKPKEKPIAAKPKGKPKAVGAEVGKMGQARRAISKNKFNALMKEVGILKGRADSQNGSLRELISTAVTNDHLDKEVFSLIRKLDRKEPEDLLRYLENLELYLDHSGLNDRADSVGKLPLGPEKPADAENEDEGPETAPAMEESNVTRLRGDAA